jgi:hypothetical protein
MIWFALIILAIFNILELIYICTLIITIMGLEEELQTMEKIYNGDVV